MEPAILLGRSHSPNIGSQFLRLRRHQALNIRLHAGATLMMAGFASGLDSRTSAEPAAQHVSRRDPGGSDLRMSNSGAILDKSTVSSTNGALMFSSPRRQLEFCVLALLLLLSSKPPVRGQSILDEKLQVAKGLQPLDNAIREQLITLFNKQGAAEASHGRESAEWFETHDRNNPLAVYGAILL